MNIPTNKLPDDYSFPEKKKEEKSTRGIEITGICISVLLIVGIIFTLVKTMQWHATNHKRDMQAMDEWFAQQMTKDSIDAAVQAQQAVVTVTQTTSVDHESQKNSNMIIYDMIYSEIDSGNATHLVLRADLDLLKAQANILAMKIEQMKTDIDELMSARFVDEVGDTKDYFIAQENAIDLLTRLKEFRKEECESFSTAHIANANDQANLMPLDDITPISGVESWDIYQFQNGPSDAKDYLDKLELQLRIFEGALIQQVAGYVN